MCTTFEKIKLKASWILRGVERIKRIKIQSCASEIPVGFSVTEGFVVVLLSLTVLFSAIFPFDRLIGSVRSEMIYFRKIN